MPISKEFQERLTDLVEESGIKKSQLPDKMGVDYRSLSHALNYGIVPRTRIVTRMANYFDVSINYILGRSNDDYFKKATITSDFNTRFVALCKEKNVTYYKVGQDNNFDKSYVSKWLKKNYIPSLDILDLLSDYFEVSIDYLLGRTDDRN